MAPSDISLFWKFLKYAKETEEVIEIDSNIVTSSVRLSQSEQTLKRREAGKVKVVSKVLTLEGGTTFPNSVIGKLYVRKVYDKLTDIAFDILMRRQWQMVGACNLPVEHLFVSGSPGNGKTLWGFYLLYRLSKEASFSDRALIWEDLPKQGTGFSLYFKGTEVRYGEPGDFDLLGGESAIFLVNGPVLRIRQKVAQIIMFCWADLMGDCRQVYKDSFVDVRYMPMWDLCELVLGGTNLDYDTIKESHRKFGGSARSVLFKFNNPEWTKKFENALSRVQFTIAVRHEIGSMLEETMNRNFIFHLKVTDEACLETAVVFASRYVEEQIMESIRMRDLRTVAEYVNRYIFIRDEAVLVGKQLEFLFHKLMALPHDFVFQTRRMGYSAIECVEFKRDGGDRKVNVFRTLDDIPVNKLGYFDPDYASYLCYDTIMVLKGSTSAFQVTVNKEHPAQLEYVEDLVDNHLLTKFFYVVPENMFEDFPVQKCKKDGVEYPWPDEVQVWVLRIPAAFYNFYKQ